MHFLTVSQAKIRYDVGLDKLAFAADQVNPMTITGINNFL